MSPAGHVWDALFRKRTPVLPICTNTQPSKRSGPWFQRPQLHQSRNSIGKTCVALCEANGSQSPPPPQHIGKVHILKWPLIWGSLRITCAIIMLSDQRLDAIPLKWMDHLCKEAHYLNLERFLNNIWEKEALYAHRRVLDLRVLLVKNGTKNERVAFVFLFIVATKRWLHSKRATVVFAMFPFEVTLVLVIDTKFIP